MHITVRRLFDALKELRHIDGYAEPGKVASYLGESAATITNWKARGMSKQGILKANQLLGVDARWLATGNGSMHPADHAGDPPQAEEPRQNPLLSPRRKSIKLKGRIRMLDGRGNYEEQELLESELGMVACYSDDPEAYALRVKGDYLHPVVKNGAILVIEPNTPPMPEDMVLLHLRDGRRMVRELIMMSEDRYVLEAIAGGDRMTIEPDDLHPERGLQHINAVVSPRGLRSMDGLEMLDSSVPTNERNKQ